jgi:hypothetical protein
LTLCLVKQHTMKARGGVDLYLHADTVQIRKYGGNVSLEDSCALFLKISIDFIPSVSGVSVRVYEAVRVIAPINFAWRAKGIFRSPPKHRMRRL